MASKLSPEFFVAKVVRLSTNGRIISGKWRRILTIILIPVWLLSIYGIVNAVSEAVVIINKSKMYYQDEYLKKYLPEPIMAFIGTLLFLIVPWIVIRLTFWVIDADKGRNDK